jgi:hypothetical protein
MSIECNNTTPLGSRAGEELLDANSAALINAIIDLASLAEEDNPLSELDRNTVLDVTNGLNNILENTPLDGLNSLQAKLDENGGKLLPTDVAEFALNTNTDLTKIKEAVDNYNTNLPNSSSLTPAGTSTQAGQSGQFSDISGIVGQEGVVSDGSGTLPVETDEDLSIGGIGVNGKTDDIEVPTTSVQIDTGSGVSTGTSVTGDGGVGATTGAPLGGSTTSTTTTGFFDATATGSSTSGTGVGGTGVGGTGTGTGLAGGSTSGSSNVTTASGLTGNVSGVTSTSGVQIDTGSGSSSVIGGATGINTSSFSSGNTPFTSDQLTALAVLSAGASSDSGSLLTRTQLLNVLGGRQTLMPVILQNLLKDMDFNFATNLGQNLTGRVCGAYSDVLADLTKAFAKIDTGKKAIDQLSNFIEKDVKKLAESLKQRGVLATLMSILEKIIEGAIKAALGLAIAAVGSVVAVVKGISSAAAPIMRKINKMLRSINDYMQDASVKKIIEDMERLIVNLAEQFERLTPQNIANIMFRLCQMAQDLQAKLMQPSIKLRSMANSVGREARAVKSQSALNTQQAVKYGAVRVSDNEREAKKKKAWTYYKSTPPSNREADYVDDGDPTSSEISTIQSVSESGLGGNITFSSAVVNEGDGKGWKEIDDSVYARLLRIVAQTGESYEVKQGFKVRAKSRDKLGGAKMNSHHSGFAIDIVTTESNRENTIVAASRAGFTGIGVYNGHLHLDLAARRGWQKGYSGTKFNDIQDLLDKHTIDGFKKKRS